MSGLYWGLDGYEFEIPTQEQQPKTDIIDKLYNIKNGETMRALKSIEPKGRLTHAIAGAFVAGGVSIGFYILGADPKTIYLLSILAACGLGVGVKLADKITKKGTFDIKDAFFTGLGGAVVTGAVYGAVKIFGG